MTSIRGVLAFVGFASLFFLLLLGTSGNEGNEGDFDTMTVTLCNDRQRCLLFLGIFTHLRDRLRTVPEDRSAERRFV